MRNGAGTIASSPTQETGESPGLAHQSALALRWRPRDWPVRGKLAAVLVVPALVAIVLGAARVRGELDLASQAGVLEERIVLVADTTALAHVVQHERELATVYLATGQIPVRAELTSQQQAADQAVAKVRDRLAGIGAQETARRLDDLTALRSRVTGAAYSDKAYSERSMQAGYAAVIDPLLAITGTVSRDSDDHTVQRSLGALSTIGRAIEQIKVQQALLLGAVRRGALSEEEIGAFRVAEARAQAARADFAGMATPEQRRLYSEVVDGPDGELRTKITSTMLAKPDAIGAEQPDWDKVSQAIADRLVRFESDLLAAQERIAQQLGAEAKTNTLQDTALVIGALLAAFALTLSVASMLLRPLWALRQRAFAVAEKELPAAIQRIEDSTGEVPEITVAPVPVTSREEIGQVARAFDAVHSEAVRLATKQALLRNNVNDIFVNLSRRTQNLVEQQLALIDQMEAGEQDPDQMESLFQLDHLATRMRRNSENLLILAGVGLGRRFTRPVLLSDVLRAAVSEVEQYRRVVIGQAPPAAVVGTAVSDVVHLLAELLDNATTFSPPDAEVVLASRFTSTDEVVIEVVDQGIGLPHGEVEALNQRLAQPPEVDAAVSRRLGLYVVSRLASRHGILARLIPNRTNRGTTAQVTLPTGLLQSITSELAAPDALIPTRRLPDSGPETGVGFGGRNGHPVAAEFAAAGANSGPDGDDGAGRINGERLGEFVSNGRAVAPKLSNGAKSAIAAAVVSARRNASGASSSGPAAIAAPVHSPSTLPPFVLPPLPAGPGPAELPAGETVLASGLPMRPTAANSGKALPAPRALPPAEADRVPAAEPEATETVEAAVPETVVPEAEILEADLAEEVVAEEVVAEAELVEAAQAPESAEEPVIPWVSSDPVPEPAPAAAEPAPDPSLEPALIYESMMSAWFFDPKIGGGPGAECDPVTGDKPRWQSPFDELWSQAAGAQHPEAAGVTESGLPVRRRGAQLIPGSTDLEPEPEPLLVPSPQRDPNALHAHMARYQEGLRHARRDKSPVSEVPEPAAEPAATEESR